MHVITDSRISFPAMLWMRGKCGININNAYIAPADADRALRKNDTRLLVIIAVTDNRSIFITKFTANSTSAYTVTFKSLTPEFSIH